MHWFLPADTPPYLSWSLDRRGSRTFAEYAEYMRTSHGAGSGGVLRHDIAFDSVITVGTALQIARFQYFFSQLKL